MSKVVLLPLLVVVREAEVVVVAAKVWVMVSAVVGWDSLLEVLKIIIIIKIFNMNSLLIYCTDVSSYRRCQTIWEIVYLHAHFLECK